MDACVTKLLSEHLKGFSAVREAAETTSSLMEHSFKKYGPVGKSVFSSFSDGLEYLLPLKSFNTRFLILGQGDWTFILTDMQNEYCYVDAYAISRDTNCKAICVVMQDSHRELQVFEKGDHVREIQSLLDGDRWYYREEGDFQDFEDPEECQRRSKKERLSVNALRRYFEEFTGLETPDWKTAQWTQILGIERSNKDAKVPLLEFPTSNDVLP